MHTRWTSGVFATKGEAMSFCRINSRGQGVLTPIFFWNVCGAEGSQKHTLCQYKLDPLYVSSIENVHREFTIGLKGDF